MEIPADGFEFLENLKQQNGKQIQTFRNYSIFLESKAREKGTPLHGQFELTPLCNFNCKMCYVHLNAEQLRERSVFSVDAWKNLMHQAWKAGMISASLTGGECLAYPGFEELFLYLHSLGCEVGVLTNGYLLDEKRINFFKQHMPSVIQVTLYGWNDDVYERVTGQRSFGIVKENIEKAIQSELPVSMTITPSDFLGKDVFETVRVAKELCKEVNVNSGLFYPREETGRSRQRVDAEAETYVRIYQLINKLNGREAKEFDIDKLPPTGGPYHECDECGLRCGGGRSGFVMTWDGKMMPCNRMSMIQADAVHEGFSAAWVKINREANNWPRVPECKECPYDGVCSNCAGNMLRFAKAGEKPNELCKRTRFYVSKGVRHIPECEN
ncbi:MAG: radical SAM protein [Clostridiales bacterium]|nr:radical SAM protein [Clostridiales bacterium]